VRSAVPMLAFSKTGIPCIGPRTFPCLRSASRASAVASASGLVSITEPRVGPWRFVASILARYNSVMRRAVYLPDCILLDSSSMVISSSSKAGGSAFRAGESDGRAGGPDCPESTAADGREARKVRRFIGNLETLENLIARSEITLTHAVHRAPGSGRSRRPPRRPCRRRRNRGTIRSLDRLRTMARVRKQKLAH
jgi:hypothetical protein